MLEPTSVDYGAVIGDMGSAVGDDGAQAALQSTNALNSVLNAKAGADGNDTQAAGERAKVNQKHDYTLPHPRTPGERLS